MWTGKLRRGILLATTSLPLALSQEVAIRTDVYRVEVTIAVEDSKGRTPGNLRASDFRLWDNGKEQAVGSLDFLSTGALEPLPELPPNTYVNRYGAGGRPQILSMILIDALNTHYRKQPAVRQAVGRILEQIAPDEKVAIFALGAALRVRVLHDFSSDRRSLLSRIAQLRPEVSIFDQDNEDLDDLFSDDAPFAAGNPRKIILTLETLEQLADYVRGLPGRKNLIWLSGAFPLATAQPAFTGSSSGSSAPELQSLRQAMDAKKTLPGINWQSFQPEMDRTIRALNAANVVVYPVDSRALSTNPRASINQGTMNEIAYETGGRAFYNRNDIDRSVRLALDDSREVYLLTYAPRGILRDGGYHRINVQTTKPGLRLRFRRGYYAPDSEETAEASGASRLERTLGSPLDATAVGIRATLSRSGLEPNQVTLLLNINMRDVGLVETAGRWSGALRIEVVQTTPSGGTLGGVRQQASVTLSKEAYDRAAAEGLQFRIPVTCGAGANGFRVAVLDERSGRAGSISVPITVR